MARLYDYYKDKVVKPRPANARRLATVSSCARLWGWASGSGSEWVMAGASR